MRNDNYTVTCENIKTLPNCRELTIVAGASGAGRQIRWVHYVEEPSYIQFLKGGELVLTTGLLLRNRESFLSFIEDLHTKQASGLVINEIPAGGIPFLQDIKDLADRLGLCVLSLPFHCHFVDIVQSITEQIFLNQKQKYDLDTTLFSLFFDPSSPALHSRETLSQCGLLNHKQYCCFVFRFQSKGMEPPNLIHNSSDIMEIIYAHQRQTGRSIFCLPHGNELLGIFSVKEGDTIETRAAFCKELTTKLSQHFEGFSIFAGIGENIDNLADIRTCMENTRGIASLAAGLEMPFLKSERCGFYNILNNLQNPELLDEIYRSIMGPLMDFDAKRGGNLVRTLEQYLVNSGSLQKTADDLYIHYNTLRYRLKTIESLLERDLSFYPSIFELMLTFFIRQYSEDKKRLS